MKRLNLSETNYIEVTDEQYEGLPNKKIQDIDSGEFLFNAKIIRIADKNIILLADEKLFVDTIGEENV